MKRVVTQAIVLGVLSVTPAAQSQTNNCGPGATDCVADIAAAVSATSVCPLSSLPAAPRPLLHTDQDIYIAGKYRMKDGVLQSAHGEDISGYDGVPADRFMTQTMALPTGPKVIKSMMYPVDGDPEKIGYRLIPVSDRAGGSDELDAVLREQMGLRRGDPIFAQVASNHPEAWNLTLENMGDQYAPQNAQTHSRGYLGLGRPIDSPENYHMRQWKNKGYPFTLYTVKLGDTPYAVTNQNAQIAWMVLSKDVRFPGGRYGGRNYKNDFYKTVDLATHLWFYENWILLQGQMAGVRTSLRGDRRLLDDPDFYTYCREAATIAETAMLNVPHNEDAFKEIWGDEKGAELFRVLKGAWPNIVEHRRSFTNGAHERQLPQALPETDFTPLWKLEGISDPTSATWERLESEGKPGWAGTVMPPQTSADLVMLTVSNYVPWIESGGVLTAAAVMGFKGQIEERTGMGSPNYRESEGVPSIRFSENTYVDVAIPIMAKLQIADALSSPITNEAELAAFVERRTAELAGAFAGGQEPGPEQLGLAQGIMQAFQDPDTRNLILGCGGSVAREQAWTWLRQSIQPDLELARSLPVCEGCVKWYQQPATTHWVALGLWPKSEFVTITPVATAVDAGEVETVRGGSQRIPTPTAAPAPPVASAETRVIRGRTITTDTDVKLPNACNFRKSDDTSLDPHFFASKNRPLHVLGFSENGWVKVRDTETGKVGFFGPVCWR